VSLLEGDEHGLIKTITVMTRPLSRLGALGDAVGAQRATSRWFHPPASGGSRHNASAGHSRIGRSAEMTDRQVRPQP